MAAEANFDALIIGGGPSGSTCAHHLHSKGLRVAILDAARFPRDKLCTGWISPPIWDILEIAPKNYPHHLWEWNRAHIHYRGKSYTFRNRGYFIRRYEFDQYLLKRGRAPLVEGHVVRAIKRDQGAWVIDGRFRTKHLVGAGGSACPVARALFPKRLDPPVIAQEREFQTDEKGLALSRMGRDGEPELLLHDDLKGYSWNVPKTAWLNIGSGTLLPRGVLRAWDEARSFFQGKGHLPEGAREELDKMKGHYYHLFKKERITQAEHNGAFLVGDALGLAQPFTGEGILPAVLSGKICAEAILSGNAAQYPRLLSRHPIMKDYGFYCSLQRLPFGSGKKPKRATPSGTDSWVDRVIAKIFVSLFSGESVSFSRLLRGIPFFLSEIRNPVKRISEGS